MSQTASPQSPTQLIATILTLWQDDSAGRPDIAWFHEGVQLKQPSVDADEPEVLRIERVDGYAWESVPTAISNQRGDLRVTFADRSSVTIVRFQRMPFYDSEIPA